MVVVGSVYEKNKIIKDPDQEIYARHYPQAFLVSLRSGSTPSLLRTCQNNGKISMVLDPLYYYFVFLIYTDGYSNHHGVYVIRYWLLIFVFMNGDL